MQLQPALSSSFLFMMETNYFSFVLLCTLLFLVNSLSNADHQHSAMDYLEPLIGIGRGNSSRALPQLKNYLAKLGYLNTYNTNTKLSQSTTVFDEALEEAVKKYQSFFNLPTTGALDGATLAQMGQPRCGVADHFFSHNTSVHFTFFPGNPKWPADRRSLTYSFPPGTRSDAHDAVQGATAMWASVSPFKFSYTENYNAADIKISFETRDHHDGSSFDGSGGVLAHAFAPTDGRLHFDAEERWVNGVSEGAFDILTVGLHELGHVLGLGHSADGGSIMWPYIGSANRKGLNKDDIDGITELYK